MFDCSAEFHITAHTNNGKLLLAVRWPSDQEWEDRYLGRKILIKRQGRGISETTIDAVEADAKLYEKIRMNGAPPLTAAEASRLIDTMSSCEVTGVEIEGQEANVELLILTGKVNHRLKIPSADDVLKLNRATRVLNMPYNVQQLRIGISVGGTIWDSCGGRSSDYNGAVPAVHKDAAVREVIATIDREMGASNDERGF